jgi:hypothetical protein
MATIVSVLQKKLLQGLARTLSVLYHLTFPRGGA